MSMGLAIVGRAGGTFAKPVSSRRTMTRTAVLAMRLHAGLPAVPTQVAMPGAVARGNVTKWL